MRIFYSLLVSGMLILPEAALDQHPLPTIHDPVYRAVSASNRSEFSIARLLYTTQYKSSFVVPKQVEGQPPYVEANHLVPEDAALNYAHDSSQNHESKATATPVPKFSTADDVLATYQQQSALPVTGYAMYYNPNVMQEVLSNRMAMGHISLCPECVGHVALLRAGDLNRRVWLEWSDGTVEGPFLVADTAARHHVAQLLARRWVVDVDHRTAVRRGMAGPVMVTVWGAPPASQQASPPFAPLYSTLPTALPLASPTSLPALNATPYIELAAVSHGFPAATPVPTMTPLPAIAVTSLPVAMPVPTQTPVPPGRASPIPTSGVVRHGFPADTPVPSATPLPAIVAKNTPAAISTTLPMPLPTLTLTPTVTQTPATSPSPRAERVVVQRGFPPDTPVPTVTPLPFITSTATPAPN